MTVPAFAAGVLGVGTAVALPIPEDPTAPQLPSFLGRPARAHPIRAELPPRHPFMAVNGRSNLHNDAYQTDVYRQAGPLGRSMTKVTTELLHECGSVTFDSKGRIVTVCVGLEGPLFVALMDPRTLDLRSLFPLPPRQPGLGLLTDFSAGGYFYLDNHDRAVVPTTQRHLWVVAQTEGILGPGFRLARDFDLTSALPSGDAIISALPDWEGRIWVASRLGVVATVDPESGAVRALDLSEPIGNSFSVDETGGVFIVTDKAMYRFDASRAGGPKVSWRRRYGNIGTIKPGQTQAGSGTTPTLIGRRWVAITDNADPMNVLVYNRRRGVRRRLVCKIPVFRKGAGDTDQSLIGINRSLIVENNYGYEGPLATMNGVTSTPGLERVDIDRDGDGCHRVWRSREIAPSVVPKLSLRAGLVYTYTKPAGVESDPWYLTALDYRTGRTVYKRLAGQGLGYNNHYAPISIGPDGTAYVATFGGFVALRDG
jgi:hypothetical protein